MFNEKYCKFQLTLHLMNKYLVQEWRIILKIYRPYRL